MRAALTGALRRIAWATDSSHGLAHLGGMPQSVEAYERLAPVDVGLLGPAAVVQVAHALMKLVQQTDRLQRWQARRWRRWARSSGQQYRYGYSGHIAPSKPHNASGRLPATMP
jgi:hypothetical protein